MAEEVEYSRVTKTTLCWTAQKDPRDLIHCPTVVESSPQLCRWTHRGVGSTGRVRFLCSSLPMMFLWNILSTEGKHNHICATLPLAPEVHNSRLWGGLLGWAPKPGPLSFRAGREDRACCCRSLYVLQAGSLVSEGIFPTPGCRQESRFRLSDYRRPL